MCTYVVCVCVVCNTSSDISIGLGKSVYELEGSIVANSTVTPDDMDIDVTNDIGDDEFGNEFQLDLVATLKEIEQKSLGARPFHHNLR